MGFDAENDRRLLKFIKKDFSHALTVWTTTTSMYEQLETKSRTHRCARRAKRRRATDREKGHAYRKSVNGHPISDEPCPEYAVRELHRARRRRERGRLRQRQPPGVGKSRPRPHTQPTRAGRTKKLLLEFFLLFLRIFGQILRFLIKIT